MANRRKGADMAVASLLFLLEIAGARAQPMPQMVKLGRLVTAVTRPAHGPPPHVAIIYENGAGSLSSSICTEMAERGFVASCALEMPDTGPWERVALDVAAQIGYLRHLPGITKVVLYGHSGGGAVASFYQATAENGLAFCQDKRKLSACSNDLAHLPLADGVVFPDAHPGLAVMDLRMIDPAVTSNGRQLHTDPALDPFNPANGFNATGPSHYAPAFQSRYIAAQAAEMSRLAAQAGSLKSALRSGEITDPAADRITFLSVGFANHLDELDPAIAATMFTSQPRALLRNDGSIVVQPIRSVSVGNPNEAHPPGGSRDVVETTAEFFSRSATRATDSQTGIDWCSSNSVTACNTRSIHVPVLFIAMGANDFIGDEERMYEASPARDKTYIVVAGALHSGAPCVKCEASPGEYSNSQKNMYDYIGQWISHRF